MPVDGNFYRTKNRAGEPIWAGYCIPCTKAVAVEWQKANPEKKAASDRKQNQKPSSKAAHAAWGKRDRQANPEKHAARVKAWNEANPGRATERMARWVSGNRERFRETQRHHYWHGEGRRERVLDHIRLRHAFLKDKEINGDDGRKLNRSVWLAILAAFDNRCCYCDSPDEITIEHLTAIRRGGRNELGNIAPACATCNKRKKAKSAEQFSPSRAAEIRRKAMICEVVAQAA
jgi:hypothetical protein